MKEYIEREAAIAFMNEVEPCICHDPDGAVFTATKDSNMLEFLRAIPAADVVYVQHGRWIDDKVAFYRGCSECGCYLEYAVDTFLDGGDHYHYCPNCGALMDKDGDGE